MAKKYQTPSHELLARFALLVADEFDVADLNYPDSKDAEPGEVTSDEADQITGWLEQEREAKQKEKLRREKQEAQEGKSILEKIRSQLSDKQLRLLKLAIKNGN